MPNANDLSPRRTRGTIQSVDRAARILKALASGPRRLGVSQLADQLGMTADRPRAAPDAAGARLRRAGPRLRQVPARRRPAAPRQLLPRPQRAARRARSSTPSGSPPAPQAAVRVGVLHGASGRRRAPRLPPRRRLPGARGRRAAARPRQRARQGDARPRARAVVDDLTDEPLVEAHPAHAHRGRAAQGAQGGPRAGLARERDEAVLGESSVAAPIHDSAGHAVGAIGVVGDTERILPRGPARGLGPAVIEAARSVSRELGAGRWTGG